MTLPPLDNTSGALRRAWHAVCTSDELGTDPLGVALLGEPWVVVRLGGGLRAFADRCPHRLAPLSAGCVVGAELQCGYHGWRFAADGACSAIPALGEADRIPGRAALVPAAAVAERHGLIWLAPEPPAAPLASFPWSDAPGFDVAFTTSVRTPVSAAQLVDNFLDAAHFPFVHPGTFGVDAAAPVTDRGVVRTDDWAIETTFDSWYAEAGLVQPQVLLKRGFASYTVELMIELPETHVTMAILFACTPETATRTRIHKLVARNDLAGDAGKMAALVAEEDAILAEDLEILERYHEMELHLELPVEVHTRADRLSVAWRRLMADLVTAPPSDPESRPLPGADRKVPDAVTA